MKIKFFKLFYFTLICVLLFASSGCSVFMAVKQDDKKNLSVLEVGTSRAHVIGELGSPILMEEKEGKKVDVFKFVQGYSTGAKAGRAFFHGAADVFTLFLWEVIGTPAEMIADGTEMKIKIVYDENDNVENVTYLELPKKQKRKNKKEVDLEENDKSNQPTQNFGPKN